MIEFDLDLNERQTREGQLLYPGVKELPQDTLPLVFLPCQGPNPRLCLLSSGTDPPFLENPGAPPK